MTQPAGSVTYNNYELLLHGVSYGITDRVQASVTVLSPIVRDMPFVGFASVKGRVVSTDRFHLALQGSAGWGHVVRHDRLQRRRLHGRRGRVRQLLPAAGLLVAAVGQRDLPAGHRPVDRPAGRAPVIYGGSIVHRVSNHVKLLGEVTSAAGRAATDGLQNVDGVLVGYGVRFHTDDIAADVGFLKPIATQGRRRRLPRRLPFVNVSYRWQ